MSNFLNCFLLIFFVTLIITLPLTLSYLILKKKGKWYKYYVLTSIFFYVFGSISIMLVEYLEVRNNVLNSIFPCNMCNNNYDLGLVIIIYHYSLLYIFVFPLLLGSLIWFYNANAKR